MKALRRTVHLRSGQTGPLDLNTICDKSRALGKHKKCNKQRQAEGIARSCGEND